MDAYSGLALPVNSEGIRAIGVRFKAGNNGSAMAIYSENVSELAQMTLNERFYARDLIELWDDAVERGDRTAIIALLARVELGDQAEAVADAVLGTRS